MTSEERARVGDVELRFDQRGDPAHPTVLLVMGLGLQMVWWREDLCDALAARGLHVVRFDNRDVGRSSGVAGPGVSAAGFLLRRASPAYALGDMADDAAGLLGHLDTSAHVVGVSLGALVAQEAAIRHPDRIRSLVSIMGRPGDGRTGRVAPSMWWRFVRPPSRRDPAEDLVRTFHRIGSVDRGPQDDADVRELVARSARRERHPDGAGRQLAAIIAERDRTADLGRLAVPALVVHGTRDRVIRPSGGRATAAAIPGAELLEVEGMGHDLPRRVWPLLLDGIERTVRAGEAQVSASASRRHARFSASPRRFDRPGPPWSS